MSFLKPSELTKIPEYTDWSNEKEIELSNNIKINFSFNLRSPELSAYMD
jgi:hypothetical protein